MDSAQDLKSIALQADVYLRSGEYAKASETAVSVLRSTASQVDSSNAVVAWCVLLQADYFCQRLTDLREQAQQLDVHITRLPPSVVLLWGVIALDLGQQQAARSMLEDYVTRNLGPAPAVRLDLADPLALARLYGVRLLAQACGDPEAARRWIHEADTRLADADKQKILREVAAAEADLPNGSNGAKGKRPKASSHWLASPEGGGSSSTETSRYCTMTGELEEFILPQTSPPLHSHPEIRPTFSEIEAASPSRSSSPAPFPTLSSGVGRSLRDNACQLHEWTHDSTRWASQQARSLWSNAWVQGTREQIKRQPVEAAVAAGAAAVVVYCLWAERRALRRRLSAAQQGLTSAAAQLAGMGLGLNTAVDPMNVAPWSQRR